MDMKKVTARRLVLGREVVRLLMTTVDHARLREVRGGAMKPRCTERASGCGSIVSSDVCATETE
jgi:hypothetical protein